MAAALAAIAVVQQDRKLVLDEVQLPPLQEHQVYVKVSWAAFNPTDRLCSRSTHAP